MCVCVYVSMCVYVCKCVQLHILMWFMQALIDYHVLHSLEKLFPEVKTRLSTPYKNVMKNSLARKDSDLPKNKGTWMSRDFSETNRPCDLTRSICSIAWLKQDTQYLNFVVIIKWNGESNATQPQHRWNWQTKCNEHVCCTPITNCSKVFSIKILTSRLHAPLANQCSHRDPCKNGIYWSFEQC